VPKREFRLVLRAELALRRNPEKAAAMRAYMKSAMPYLGIQTPQLRAICKRLFAAHPIQTAVAWRKTCLGIWRGAKYREERYAAIGLTGYRLYRTFQTLATLPMYEEMIVTGAWWDFVDEIASRRLGPLLQLYPQPMRGEMLRWSRSENLWKRRSAILCQLSFKQQTDLALLYACIKPSFDSREFFLQKAIGWALRQYAWASPREVRRYVRAHADQLSALSRREALKNIEKR
jgi:3-methyladenine DNA glycosylase AlkD